MFKIKFHNAFIYVKNFYFLFELTRVNLLHSGVGWGFQPIFLIQSITPTFQMD